MPCGNKTYFSPLGIVRRPRVAVRSPRPKWLDAILRTYRQLLERRKQRQTLLELNDHMLSDIGLSREEASREASKWFWR